MKNLQFNRSGASKLQLIINKSLNLLKLSYETDAI